MPEKNPIVSVIIPTYNRAHLVGRAIRSVLNQTYQNFEIIVVDDGSIDNTEEVIKNFNDPRIRYIRHEKNRGGSAARNTGIRVARGEYIAFLDSDDEWLPAHLCRKLDLLKATGAAGIAGSYYVVYGDRMGERRCRPKPSVTPMAEYILSRAGDIRTSTMMFCRETIAKIMFDEDLRKHQDWDLAIRFEKSFTIIIDLKATVVVYENLPDRMSNFLDHAATWRFLEKHWITLSRETKARFCLLLAWRTFTNEGRSENFRKWLRKAREACPHKLILRSVLETLSIPLVDKCVALVLSSRFWYKQFKTTKKLKPNWRVELGLPLGDEP